MTESSTATLELDDTGAYRLWSADARFEAAHPELYATQPALGALVYGDLCDITVGRRYCGQDATREAVDADGSTRILCAHHAALYFPTH